MLRAVRAKARRSFAEVSQLAEVPAEAPFEDVRSIAEAVLPEKDSKHQK